MRRHRWFLIVLFIAIAGLIVVSLALYRQQSIREQRYSTPDNGSHVSINSRSLSKTALSEPFNSPSGQSTRDVGMEKLKKILELARRDGIPLIGPFKELGLPEPASSSASDLPDSRQKRIEKVYERLSREGISFTDSYPREVIAIMVEGMDAFSAAEYLKERSLYEHALEYAEKALAENPDSFETLLLRTQLLPPERDDEREAGFRRLLEMNPNSVEALVGLGTTIQHNHPLESISYLKKAIEIDPSYNRGVAYVDLGWSYEKLGRYDEALEAFKKGHEIYPGQVSGAHIQAIEDRNPILKPIQLEQEQQEVYQGAMKRFPEDKRIRQEWDTFRNKRSRPMERHDEKNSDSSKEDAR